MSRLHRTPMRTLIEEIVAGEHAPGDMLPREVDLAKRFDVSRGVVRECLRGLEERGLIAVKHGRGATVRDPVDWDVFATDVAAALGAAPAGRQFLGEAVECQRVFETEAAGLAAARAKRRHLEELSGAFESLEAAAARSLRTEAAVQRYREADLEFHRAVVRASGNRLLVRLSEPLHRALVEAGAEDREQTPRQTEHERILAAITAGDVEAARAAMTKHLDARAKRLLSRKRSR